MKVRLVDVRQRFEVEHGGVVDQNVDRAEGRHRLGDHGFDIRGFGQVALNGDRLPTRCFDLARNALGAFVIASVADGDVRAGSAKRRRDACTDPFRCARHQGDLARQLAVMRLCPGS